MLTDQNQLRIPFFQSHDHGASAYGKCWGNSYKRIKQFNLFRMLLITVLWIYLQSVDAVSLLQLSVEPVKQWISASWRRIIENYTLVSLRSEFLGDCFCFCHGYGLIPLVILQRIALCDIQCLCCSQEFLVCSCVLVYVLECAIMILCQHVCVGDRLEVRDAEKVTME